MNTTSTKGLKVGDIFKVTKKAHTATNNVFKFISYTENGSIRAVKYPNYYGQSDPVTITHVDEGGFKKLSKDEISKIRVNPIREYAKGSTVKGADYYEQLAVYVQGVGSIYNGTSMVSATKKANDYLKKHPKAEVVISDEKYGDTYDLNGNMIEEYANGGRIGGFFNKAKDLGAKGVNATKKAIRDKQKKIAISVIDDTKDKVGDNKSKMILKGAEQIVADKYAKGSTVKGKRILNDNEYKAVLKKLDEIYGINAHEDKIVHHKDLWEAYSELTESQLETPFKSDTEMEVALVNVFRKNGWSVVDNEKNYKYAKGSTVATDVKAILDAKRAKIKQRKAKRKQ